MQKNLSFVSWNTKGTEMQMGVYCVSKQIQTTKTKEKKECIRDEQFHYFK